MTSTEAAPGGGIEDLLQDIDVVDPYPVWQALLDGGPVVAPDGSSALLSRHAACDAVLRAPDVSSEQDWSSLLWRTRRARSGDRRVASRGWLAGDLGQLRLAR